MATDVHSTPSARQAAVPRRRFLLCEIAAVPSGVTVVSVAEPFYTEPPYAGFADPGEEQTHRRFLEERRRICAAAESTPRRSSRSVTQPPPSWTPRATAPTSSRLAPAQARRTAPRRRPRR
jgi:hypothetical protein